MPVEKSKDTIVCTESTSGVESPASSRYAVSYRLQWRASPRQPIASIAKTTFCHFCLAVSRIVAKSGINPMNQKSAETVAYVETAKTSHISGLRKFGHMPIVFG